MNYTRRAMMKDGLLAVSAGMIMPSIFARAVRAAQNAAHEGDTWAQAALGRTLDRRADGGRQRRTEHHRSLHRRPTTRARARRSRVGADQVLDLNGRLGLHPALAALQPLWNAHKVGGGRGRRLPELQPLALRRDGYLADGGRGWAGALYQGRLARQLCEIPRRYDRQGRASLHDAGGRLDAADGAARAQCGRAGGQFQHQRVSPAA